MKNSILITIVVAVVVGGVGFYAGMKYQQMQRSTFFGQFNNGQVGFGTGAGQTNGANRIGARQVVGEILSQNDKSLTVKLADGSSKIVFLSDTTTINKATTAAKTDLKVGERVGVFGLDNSDGSVTAQSIQLNPISRGMNGTGTPQPK